MRLERRRFKDASHLLLILEDRDEEQYVMQALGDPVEEAFDDDCQLPIKGVLKASDGGLGELYISVERT